MSSITSQLASYSYAVLQKPIRFISMIFWMHDFCPRNEPCTQLQLSSRVGVVTYKKQLTSYSQLLISHSGNIIAIASYYSFYILASYTVYKGNTYSYRNNSQLHSYIAITFIVIKVLLCMVVKITFSYQLATDSQTKISYKIVRLATSDVTV